MSWSGSIDTLGLLRSPREIPAGDPARCDPDGLDVLTLTNGAPIAEAPRLFPARVDLETVAEDRSATKAF